MMEELERNENSKTSLQADDRLLAMIGNRQEI